MLGLLGGLRLRLELKAWRRAGARPQLWWRDDDACEPTPALERLLSIAEDCDVPLALAVVPARIDPCLYGIVNQSARVWVLQHGADHRDAGDGRRPTQFSATMPVAAVAQAIAEAALRLKGFDRAAPVYVPPWNDLQPNVGQALVQLGLHGMSGDGQFRSSPGMIRVDIHLDILRWGGRPRFRGRLRVLNRLAGLLRKRRRQGRWSEPIGLLTHHLDHDEQSWAFLRWLLDWKPLRSLGDWLEIEDVFQLDRRPVR